MSQAGLIDIESSHPQIPTSFLTDAGTAIPLTNVLEIIGGTGITTSAAGNTITISGVNATAGATALLATKGISSFDSSAFKVTNGFVEILPSFGAILSIITDDGAPEVDPDAFGIVDILGGDGIDVKGQGPGNTVTISGETSTELNNGMVFLATSAQSISGNVTTNYAINPFTLKAKLGVQTNYGIALGSGSNAALSYVAAGTTGKLLVATSFAAPAWGSTSYGDFSFSNISSVATPRFLSVVNTDVNAASHADLRLSTPAGGGDSMVSWEVTGGIGPLYSAGVDNPTAGDPWKLTNSSSPSAGTTAITVLSDALTYINNPTLQTDTGFASWDAVGPYFDDTTLGDFELLVSGTGYIHNERVTWTAPQTVSGMTAGNCYWIYIDSTGTLKKTNTYQDSTFTDNIPLFECLRDSTPVTNNQVTVKENHPYKFPVYPSIYLHDVIGTVIENINNGANITLNGTKKIQINGDDVLADHGLDTDIPDSGGVAVSFNKKYTTAAGKWALQNVSDTFSGFYNAAGTPTALGLNKFGVYTLYASKDSLNSATPTYFSVLDTSQYNTAAAASSAIAAGTTAKATNELNALELCQLGYIIYGQAADAIVQVIISKATLKQTLSTSGTNSASLVNTNTSLFDGILSATDTNVQAALNTIDEFGKNLTDHALVVGNGNGNPLGVIAVLSNGQLAIGSAGADPVPATLTAGAGIGISNAAGSITISSTGSGMAWVESTGATQAMAVATAYGANRGGGVTFTLPASAAIGSVMEIVGMAGLWILAQQAGQTVYFGSVNTTGGVGGSLTATNAGDCVTLRCITADVAFRVTSSVGNITYA